MARIGCDSGFTNREVPQFYLTKHIAACVVFAELLKIASGTMFTPNMTKITILISCGGGARRTVRQTVPAVRANFVIGVWRFSCAAWKVAGERVTDGRIVIAKKRRHYAG